MQIDHSETFPYCQYPHLIKTGPPQGWVRKDDGQDMMSTDWVAFQRFLIRMGLGDYDIYCIIQWLQKNMQVVDVSMIKAVEKFPQGKLLLMSKAKGRRIKIDNVSTK